MAKRAAAPYAAVAARPSLRAAFPGSTPAGAALTAARGRKTERRRARASESRRRAPREEDHDRDPGGRGLRLGGGISGAFPGLGRERQHGGSGHQETERARLGESLHVSASRVVAGGEQRPSSASRSGSSHENAPIPAPAIGWRRKSRPAARHRTGRAETRNSGRGSEIRRLGDPGAGAPSSHRQRHSRRARSEDDESQGHGDPRAARKGGREPGGERETPRGDGEAAARSGEQQTGGEKNGEDERSSGPPTRCPDGRCHGGEQPERAEEAQGIRVDQPPPRAARSISSTVRAVRRCTGSLLPPKHAVREDRAIPARQAARAARRAASPARRSREAGNVFLRERERERAAP